MSEKRNLPNETDASSPMMSARDSEISPAFRSSEQRVGFSSPGNETSEGYKEREKYLTAKYPKHRMGLIRRRLAVEDWIDEQLKILYNVDDSSNSCDVCIDLDEVLDINDESQRLEYIEEQISDAPQSPSIKKKFIGELLEKARDL